MTVAGIEPEQTKLVDRQEAGVREVVDPAALHGAGMVPRGIATVKILGEGELTKKLVVKASAFSASAKEKIEKAGGTAELIPSSKPAKAASAG